jgi:hypothetical protein
MSCLIGGLCPWRLKYEQSVPPIGSQLLKEIEDATEVKDCKISDIREKMKGLLFLPGKGSLTVQLIYLTMIDANSLLSPFTEVEERIFVLSKKTDSVAYACLKAGCLISCCTGGIALGSVGPGCFNPSWLMGTIAVLSSSIGSGVAYLTTGCYPHIASEEANEMQNTYLKVKEVYLELASHLIQLAESNPQLAVGIAKDLTAKDIYSTMRRSLSAEDAEALIKPLENARAFIAEGKFPFAPLQLKQCAEIFLLKRTVTKLVQEKPQTLNPSISDKSLCLMESDSTEEIKEKKY